MTSREVGGEKPHLLVASDSPHATHLDEPRSTPPYARKVHMSQQTSEDLVTATEAAQELGVSERTFARYVQRGMVPVAREGKAWTWPLTRRYTPTLRASRENYTLQAAARPPHLRVGTCGCILPASSAPVGFRFVATPTGDARQLMSAAAPTTTTPRRQRQPKPPQRPIRPSGAES